MKLLISNKEIKSAIKLFSNTLNFQYENKEVIIIAILKGAILFLQDLHEHLDFKNKIEYIDISSYKGKKRGEIKSLSFKINIQNKRLWSEAQQKYIRLKVTPAAIRLIDKIGLDAAMKSAKDKD